MGVFWNSKAEVLTNNNKNALDIFYWLKSNSSVNEINIDDCSIIFSSGGYGSFGSVEEDSENGNLFQTICEKFKFPILCHERVIPCQSQGYGFYTVFGRWNDGVIRSYKEIVYNELDGDEPDECWADSAQVVNFTDTSLTDQLKEVMKRAQDSGKLIESTKSWWDPNYKIFYLDNFLNNCNDQDEDMIFNIFNDEMLNFCTWQPSLNPYFTDEFGQKEIETLPEIIDFNKLRLKIK